TLGRLRFKLQRPVPDLRPAPPLRPRAGVWVHPAMRQASLLTSTRLRVLNREYDLEDCGWDDPAVDKLARYNFHYFDDLNAREAAARSNAQRDLIERWIQDNPPARGSGWEPYPLSLRVVNWIKWLMGGQVAETRWLQSLAVQARWLTGRLERHLLGNHLFVNAKALIFAGLFFQDAEAESWLRCGTDILCREVSEQVLSDGGQFERSPMYHALACEDVLDLLNIVVAQAPSRRLTDLLAGPAARMLYWLRCMTHPDGTMGHFNDSAAGIAPEPAELERYAAELGVVASYPPTEALTHLAASGYLRAARGAAVALLDIGPIGPDYLPAHAHADTLSFELSLGARPVIVNGGTSCYGISAQRQRERGTAAHSTVQIGNADSSEVWAGFRVGRRAHPMELVVDEWDVGCSHDGYRYLPGRPTHRRSWHFGDSELRVEDTVQPPSPVAVARYILAPDLRLHQDSSTAWRVLRGDAPVAAVEVMVGRASASQSQHAPQFGVLMPADCL